MVADGVGAVACGLGRAGLAVADGVLEGLGRRCSTRLGWIPMAGQEREHLFQARGSCCLAFRIDGHGYCTSCPSTPEADRLERLRAFVDANP